jgi:hypothetical protein
MALSAMQKDIITVLLMQAVWLACVLGGSMWGWGATLLFLGCYLWLFGLSIKDALCITTIAVIGFAVDSTISAMELMIYPDKNVLAFIPLPGWMAALWLAFATLFLHGLQWLRPRPLLAAVFGGVAGPATYYSGSLLHGVQLGMMPLSFFLCYGALWSVMVPLFGSIAAMAEKKS